VDSSSTTRVTPKATVYGPTGTGRSAWFRGAGLELATASDQQITDFIRALREQTGGAQEASG
jgi:hypothetical protein